MKLIYRCLCLALGTILGVGCNSSPNETPAEYGQPHAKVRLDGHVRNSSGEPIPGIAVHLVSGYGGAAADTTDASGSWAINDDFYTNTSTHKVNIESVDFDGANNGGNHESVVSEVATTTTVSGSGSWYVGTWEKHDINIVMNHVVPPIKKKTENDN